MSDTADADVLRRFVAGDRDAFETVYRDCHREVYTWILRIVRDPTAADDALVETFWRAYRSHARFDPDRPFGAWIRRIATNAALDQLHAMARRPLQYHQGHDVAAPSRPDTDVERQIALALQRLPPKLRVVATLGLIEERSLAEIADALDVPLGTVKSRLFRATRALREDLLQRGIQP
jgi:RNA polymerase sigma-70 factor (ECF subfamily)